MSKTKQPDTIAAIATPPGIGAVGVVRISGPQARAVLEATWRPLASHGSKKLQPRQLTLGWSIKGDQKIDQTLAVIMPGPNSYTGEDVAELQTHGGTAVTRAVLAACLQAGARLAEPGEFTKRAYLNNKLDLVQAEAVLDLVQSENEALSRLASDQLAGGLSKAVKLVRDELIVLAAHLAAQLDFSEEDVPGSDAEQTIDIIDQLVKQLAGLLTRENQISALRQGFKVALVGLPNAGKSTLLNHLLGYERSIVTSLPGTTRDSIEEKITLDGAAVRLVDTAGLNDAPDQVEQLGIERTRAEIASSDLILLLVEPGREVATANYIKKTQLFEWPKGSRRPIVVVWTKSDLKKRPQPAKLGLEVDEYVLTAALKDEGLREVERVIAKLLPRVGSHESTGAITQRQLTAIKKARDLLLAASRAVAAGQPSDVVLVDIEEAIQALGGLTGETTNQEIIDALFANFCIGK